MGLIAHERTCPRCQGGGLDRVPQRSDDLGSPCPLCDGDGVLVTHAAYRRTVDLLRRAEPYVRAARHASGVKAASALADEMAALLPKTAGAVDR